MNPPAMSPIGMTSAQSARVRTLKYCVCNVPKYELASFDAGKMEDIYLCRSRRTTT